MQELEVVREKIQSKYRVVKTDEDLEWNRAIDLCTNIIKAHLSGENAAEIARSSRDTDFLSMIGILDKLSFFGGQRAGRELWNDKSRKVQDEDIASFNRDIEYLRDLIRKHMNAGERFEFDFTNVKSFDCQCGRHYVNTGAENNDGWISVKERLPEINDDGMSEDVLVSFEESNYIIMAFYNSAERRWNIHGPGPYIGRAIAWRPLPEPYRPERSVEE